MAGCWPPGRAACIGEVVGEVGGAVATALVGDAKGFLLKRFGVDPGVGVSGLVTSLEGSWVDGATKSHVSGMTMRIVASLSASGTCSSASRFKIPTTGPHPEIHDLAVKGPGPVTAPIHLQVLAQGCWARGKRMRM